MAKTIQISVKENPSHPWRFRRHPGVWHN